MRFLLIFLLILIVPAFSTKVCIDCHKEVTPGIVAQYENSKHAKENVGCADCHAALTEEDLDKIKEILKLAGVEKYNDPSIMKNHMGSGYDITPAPSPAYCAKCHLKEVREFLKSKHAWTALIGPFKIWYKEMVKRGEIKEGAAPKNDDFLKLDPYEFTSKQVTPLYPASGVLDKIGLLEETKSYGETINLMCSECHGSAVIVKNGKIIKGWPNNGVGRLNPDGVPGSCSACHTRHRFDKSEARKPETCGQCHLGPDHPQIEIYEESKHGNIYFSLENHEFLKEEKLTPENTPAPTCAVCHMSEFNGVPATHDVGERLYWELQPKFSTPQWYPANLVALGKHKPNEAKAKENRERMKQVCRGCHSSSWVEGYFKLFDEVVKQYNTVAKSAKELLDKIYAEGLADKKNPIDEYPEIMWYYIWHHDGRRWRMGASMMGPDYTHWHGIVDTIMDKYGRMLTWYELAKKQKELEEAIKKAPAAKVPKPEKPAPPAEKKPPAPIKKGICGPSAIIALAIIPLILYRLLWRRK